AVAAAIVPAAVTVKVWPLASVGAVQCTAGAASQVPAVVVTLATVTPVGTVSDSVTPLALDGPLLVTTMVYVMGPPATRAAGATDFVTAMSATLAPPETNEDVLLPGVGSLVDAATVAVLVTVAGTLFGAWTVTWRVAPPPTASVPTGQVTVPDAAVQ